MAELTAPLVLASASPRRREILERLGLSFEVMASEVLEKRGTAEGPEAYVRRLSADKARAVADRLAARTPPPFVLGADTTVVIGDALLDKPRDDDEARTMITRLSGRTHRVITGVSIARPGLGVRSTIAIETAVTFRVLAESEVHAYVASGEGRDKAGSYGIQGLGSGLVAKVNGSYDNVVGLPSADVLVLLRAEGAVVRWP